MAKKPVTKTAAKKITKAVAKKNVKRKSTPAKKTAKPTVKAKKKPLTDKERTFREANVIANSEKKRRTGDKSSGCPEPFMQAP